MSVCRDMPSGALRFFNDGVSNPLSSMAFLYMLTLCSAAFSSCVVKEEMTASAMVEL